MDLTRIPALTLINPWAHLICHAGKRVENRTWSPPVSVKRLLIHAGRAFDLDEMHDRHLHREDVTIGAIVAIADLLGSCHARPSRQTCDCDPQWARPDQCHWLLGDVTVLPEPVPCRGYQGLWFPEPIIRGAVARQLGGAS